MSKLTTRILSLYRSVESYMGIEQRAYLLCRQIKLLGEASNRVFLLLSEPHLIKPRKLGPHIAKLYHLIEIIQTNVKPLKSLTKFQEDFNNESLMELLNLIEILYIPHDNPVKRRPLLILLKDIDTIEKIYDPQLKNIESIDSEKLRIAKSTVIEIQDQLDSLIKQSKLEITKYIEK